MLLLDLLQPLLVKQVVSSRAIVVLVMSQGLQHCLHGESLEVRGILQSGLRVLLALLFCWVQRYSVLFDNVDDKLRVDFNFLVGLVLVVLHNCVCGDVVRNLCFLREDVKGEQRRTVRLTLLAFIEVLDEPRVVPDLLNRVSFFRIRVQYFLYQVST